MFLTACPACLPCFVVARSHSMTSRLHGEVVAPLISIVNVFAKNPDNAFYGADLQASLKIRGGTLTTAVASGKIHPCPEPVLMYGWKSGLAFGQCTSGGGN